MPRPPWLALVAAAVVVPSVLAGLTLLWPRPQIQSVLTERAQAALSAAGISGATVRFDGRDATITGLSGGAAAQAADVVAGATGVRVASIGAGGATTPMPTPTPTASPTPTSLAAPTSAVAKSAPAGFDPATKQALQARIGALVATTPITFNPNSPQLTPQGSATLAQVLAVVKAAPAARLELDGYVAPGRGNGPLNAQQLSDQRAAVVLDAMVAAGVPADHLTARGRGEDTTATDRALARRVDITVV